MPPVGASRLVLSLGWLPSANCGGLAAECGHVSLPIALHWPSASWWFYAQGACETSSWQQSRAPTPDEVQHSLGVFWPQPCGPLLRRRHPHQMRGLPMSSMAGSSTTLLGSSSQASMARSRAALVTSPVMGVTWTAVAGACSCRRPSPTSQRSYGVTATCRLNLPWARLKKIVWAMLCGASFPGGKVATTSPCMQRGRDGAKDQIEVQRQQSRHRTLRGLARSRCQRSR
mmetsp:Transcript_51323/g.101925  ORF Transcript_51323/g.101925 Transcript_51323/m.101925 type:complete len:229 (+) Transcript_51323:560-1246(+)